MKPALVAFLPVTLALALAGCGRSEDANQAATADTVEMPADELPQGDPSAQGDDSAAEALANASEGAADAAANASDSAADAAQSAADAARAAAADAPPARGAKPAATPPKTN